MRVQEYFAVSAAACVLLLSVNGCAERKQVGTVVGAVRYRGSVVTEGIVTLYSPEMGLAKQSPINSDGSFLIDGVRYGSYGATVQPPLISEDFGGKSMPGLAIKEVRDIPARYRDIATSGFSCDVKGRRTDLSLEME